jgi:diguanylate cyclase (GGDEF)-like protein
MVGTLVFLVAVVSEHFIHEIAESAIQDEIRGNMKRLARAAATLVDPLSHQNFTSPDHEYTPEYQDAIRALRRFQNSDGEIAYVYTCIRKGDKVYYVLDPTPAGSANVGGLKSRPHIMQEYLQAPNELLSAFADDRATADIRPYKSSRGTFISGYAPIRNEFGRTVGIAGVDLSAENFQKRLSGIAEAFQEGVWVAALLAMLSGLAAGAMQFKSVAIHREAMVRDLKYREQIALTLERVESAIRIAEVSRNRFSDLFEGIPVSCLTFDLSEKVFEWNGHALTTFGLEPQDAMQKDLQGVLGKKLYGLTQSRLVGKVLAGKSFNDQVWTDGTRHFLFSGHPLLGPFGEITGGILAAVDISLQIEAEDRAQDQFEELNTAHLNLNKANKQLQEVNARLEALATTDMLTGLPNRRAFYDHLQLELARTKRGARFALVQADIDYFKLVNDTYGHHAGDEVLQLFAKTLKDCLRPGDFVARHGGEEFYFILSGATKVQALKAVERIRQSVEEINSGYGKITASFGIALCTSDIESDDQLMQLADNALYEAKAAGRNRVVVAGGPKKMAA